MKARPRQLKPRQRCQVWIHDAAGNSNALLYETASILLEAPNWSVSGDCLFLNGNGKLWRIPVREPSLEPIEIAGVPPLNNDHVLDPDGDHVFLSAYDDWQIYRAPLKGGNAARITGSHGPEGLMHFLHGVSPDARMLAFVGLRLDDNSGAFKARSAEIFTVTADGKHYQQLTHSGAPADGPEFSPDGKWIYFNTEQFSGHAQIARMRVDGSELSRLVISTTVDWFPHLSPDGNMVAYLAYPEGTVGHPADKHVVLMLVRDGKWNNPVAVAGLYGGQGTINVNSWSPDSTRFAYVAYPQD